MGVGVGAGAGVSGRRGKRRGGGKGISNTDESLPHGKKETQSEHFSFRFRHYSATQHRFKGMEIDKARNRRGGHDRFTTW